MHSLWIHACNPFEVEQMGTNHSSGPSNTTGMHGEPHLKGDVHAEELAQIAAVGMIHHDREVAGRQQALPQADDMRMARQRSMVQQLPVQWRVSGSETRGCCQGALSVISMSCNQASDREQRSKLCLRIRLAH